MAKISGGSNLFRNHELDVRDMLLMGGVGQFKAHMSIPYMNMLPGTVEPYAQGVLQLVKGLQRLMNQRGAKLTVDGGLGAATIKRIVMYSGPRWTDRTWAQIYADVIVGERWAGFVRNDKTMNADRIPFPADAEDVPEGLGVWPHARPMVIRRRGALGDSVTDLLTNPIALAGGAFAVWWFFIRKPKKDAGHLEGAKS